MKNTIIIAILFLVFFNIQSQTIRYVTQTGAGTMNGTSWANASSDIQAMIDASFAGNQIWVAGGTYLPTKDPFGNANPADPRDKTFYMKEGVQIYGSFAGSETSIAQRNANVMAAYPSILSGDIGIANDNCYHVVLSVADGTPFSTTPTLLNGFTVTFGRADSYSSITVEGRTINRYWGGGMYIEVGATKVDSCKFEINFCGHGAVNASNLSFGGGIFNSGTSNVNNCTFSTNIAQGWSWSDDCGSGGGMYSNGGGKIINCKFFSNNALYGGGLYCDNGTEISNCLFYDNSSNSQGGAIYNVGSAVILHCQFANNDGANNGVIYNNSLGNIEDCIFTDNSGTALKNVASIVNLNDCIFYNNTGASGGGVLNESPNATFRNCIFAKNATTTNAGGAIYNSNTASLSAYNCTFANNISSTTTGGVYNANTNANTMNLCNCILWGNTGNAPQNIGGQAAVSYSLVEGATVYAGQGNINPPQVFFVDGNPLNNPAGLDNIWLTADDGLRLNCASPALNSGDNTCVLSSKDITSVTNRILEGTVNMGAYEDVTGFDISNNTGTNELTCTTTSISLTAIGGISYSWSNGLGTNPTVTVNSPGNYTVTITSANCTNTLAIPITQNTTPPTVGTNASPNTVLCPGQAVTLTGTGASFYTWNNAVQNGVAFTPTDTTTYTVTGTGSNGCTNTATITLYMPEIPIITEWAGILTCSLPGFTYQWYINDIPLTGATSQSYTPTQNGTYTVTVSTPQCQSILSTQYVLLNVAVENALFPDVSLYPNPVQDKLFIEALPLNAKLSIKNIISGSSIYQKESNQTNETLDLSFLPQGIYILAIEHKGQMQAWKIVKQ